MKPSALDYLVCTHCASPLSLVPGYETEDSSQREIYKGRLSCASCAREFAIERGVPRMVDAALSSPVDIETGHSFGVAWRQFPRLDERYRKQFFDWISPVQPSFFNDKVVLEAGCGKGRHAKIVCESGARDIFAIDIGEAVDIAYSHVGRLPGVHVIQADIENLPFKNIFDFAFSLGVLHHMEHPMQGFLSMARKLKEDGAICVWVYGQENNWWLIHIINPIRIGITCKLPTPVLHLLSGLLALPIWLASNLIFAPWKRLQARFPSLPSLYYQDYLAYISEFDFMEIHHIVFDHLVSPVASYVSQNDLRSWFSAAELPEPKVRWHNENSWMGFSQRQTSAVEEKTPEVHTEIGS